MKTHKPIFETYIEFVPKNPNNASLNSIFLDETDDSLKIKNNDGEIQTL